MLLKSDVDDLQTRGRFIEQKLMLSSSFRCDQIYNSQRYVQQTGLSLLNKYSCLARALGGTKFINMRGTIFGHTLLFLNSDLDVQQTHLSLINGTQRRNRIRYKIGVRYHASDRNISSHLFRAKAPASASLK